MAHRSILVNEPVLDAVVVIAGILAAHGEQRVSRGLHVAGFIGATGLKRGFLALPAPRRLEARGRFVDAPAVRKLLRFVRALMELDPTAA
jgi:hypothetical protein